MTKQELIDYIKARIFTNNTKAITAQKHQEALLKVAEQIYEANDGVSFDVLDGGSW